MMIRQSKHTPGPWTWDEDFNNLEPIWEMGMSQGVGYIDWKDWLNQEQRANARLIAAAPDLLEALEVADAALSGANMDMKAVERKARAAIAKAKGGVE